MMYSVFSECMSGVRVIPSVLFYVEMVDELRT